MLLKTTISSGYTDAPHIFPLDMYDYTMLKSAAEMHPDISSYIQRAKPIPGKTIVLVDALGAGDYWGSNANGDFFGEDMLSHDGTDYGYRTFMEYAYPYLEHMNEAISKDPKRRVGDRVDLSVYFKPMHRVQLIVIINRDSKAHNFVQRIDNGDYPDVSMACGVKYDQCSICGSKHRVRREYCNHARNMLNKVMPNGEKVYLINYQPRFHDISLVFLGAEKNSKVLLKVANKQAAIKKVVPGIISEAYSVPAMLDTNTLSHLSKYPIEDVMTTMNEKGLSISPSEFQYMLLSKVNQKQANDLASRGICFDPEQYESKAVPEGRFDERVEAILDYRSLNKSASALMSTQSIVAPVMAGLYKAFTNDVPRYLTDVVRGVQNNAGQAAVATGFTLGLLMAPRMQTPLTMDVPVHRMAWESPEMSLPFSKEPLIKLSSWKDLSSIGRGLFRTTLANPIIPAAAAGLIGYKLQQKKIDDMIASGSEDIGLDNNPKSMTQTPWFNAAKYGLGTFGALKLLNYFRQRGLPTG